MLQEHRRPHVCMISLGCAKNLADSETILGQIVSAEPRAIVCQEPGNADIVVVNTCGFLEAARNEADAVLSDLEQSSAATGRIRKIVAVGCYPQLWRNRVLRRHPGLYAVMGTDALYRQDFWKDLLAKMPADAGDRFCVNTGIIRRFEAPRVLSGGGAYAYLKIGDGCSQHCTYCTIPRIKGPLVSRTIDTVVHEADGLIRAGATELILVAQNTSAYGRDLNPAHRSLLPDLLKELDSLRDVRVLRLLYLYPTMITRGLLETIRDSHHIAHYVDIPLQHTDSVVLKAMGRPWSSSSTVGLVQQVREIVPDVAVRSTFIVGFPGETETQFQHLLKDLPVLRLDHASAFTYSRERLASSYGFSRQVCGSTKARRRREFMERQQQISLSINRERYTGKTVPVIVDYIGTTAITGRTLLDAPDIDNVVTLNIRKGVPLPSIGDVCQASISEIGPYDLKGMLA